MDRMDESLLSEVLCPYAHFAIIILDSLRRKSRSGPPAYMTDCLLHAQAITRQHR
jgi:hypothetical protein